MATTIASTAADGTTQGNGPSATTEFGRALSNDGRYVVFQSLATNLVGTDANGSTNADIFRKDVTTGALVRVNETAAGVQANDASTRASVSSDGRYVVFQSEATNLAGTDANGTDVDIFRKDVTTGALVRVTEASGGVQANDTSSNATISADGRYVAFQSRATNLAGADANGASFDVFRKDLTTGEVVRVSDTAANVQANNNSGFASISADGRYVAFVSQATNLAGTDANGTTQDIFRKDLTTGELVRVTETAAGIQGNGSGDSPSVSADGRYVVFASLATNLTGTDANGTDADIFRKDMVTGELVRVTETAAGVQGDGSSTNASISSDGRYVTFESRATNLVAGDNNGSIDVFVKDMVTGEILRVTNANDGTGAANGGGNPSISADGSRIAFTSDATNLVAGDGNGQQDVFVTDRPVCFAQGSAIRIVRDGAVRDLAVERVTLGDLAVTASGARRPIRWIGHRTLTCRGRTDALPVRIARDAFGEGRPARDLFVSPAHALCVDVPGEVLIPACRLINGTTITRVEVERVTYWHVELDSHDILLAEGLPAESYLDCGNRRFFVDAEATDLMAVPDARPDGALPFCRPFHETGPLVEAVRAQLEAQARVLGWRLDAAPETGLHLVVDGAVVHPEMDGTSANFVLRHEARDVRLVSQTSVPAYVVPGSADDRRLGVAIRSLVLDDGVTGARDIALDDPRLSLGFHPVDRDARGTQWRWTDGSASLPAALWAGCRGTIRVQVALAGTALPRWFGPRPIADGVATVGLRRRA